MEGEDAENYTHGRIFPQPSIQCKSKEIFYTSLKHPKPLHQQYNPYTQQPLEEPSLHNPRRQPTDEPPRGQVGASCCHLTALLAAQGLWDEEPDRLSRELRKLHQQPEPCLERMREGDAPKPTKEQKEISAMTL